MILSEMINAINRRIDDSINPQDATEFLNAGQNVLAMELNASFTQLIYTNLSGTFDFDAKYHEIPVIYACMRFKELDSVLTEAQNYRAQFEQMKKVFLENYQLPPWLRDDRLAQQFTAVEGQTAFIITKETYSPSRGVLTLYKNGSKLLTWTRVSSTIEDANLVATTTTTTNDPRGFILTYACALNDKITAVWQEHNDLVNPPYDFWAGQGW